MPDNSSNISNTNAERPERGRATYYYNSLGVCLGWTDASLDSALQPLDDCDQPLFVATPSAPNPGAQLAESYHYGWSGRELQAELTLECPGIGHCCEPTPSEGCVEFVPIRYDLDGGGLAMQTTTYDANGKVLSVSDFVTKPVITKDD